MVAQEQNLARKVLQESAAAADDSTGVAAGVLHNFDPHNFDPHNFDPHNASDGFQPAGSSVIGSGDQLNLRSWLEVSWFYPDGFLPQTVVENRNTFLAYGSTEILKFFKPRRSFTIGGGYSSQESAAEQWRRISEEIGDNLSYAPGVYRGIRALRWEDGEPLWIGERVADEINPDRPAFAADEFALALRRLPDNRRLDNLLRGGMLGTDPDRQAGADNRPLLALAAALIRQHRRSMHWGRKVFEADTQTFLELFYEKYVSELRSFILINGSYLDSFSRTVFQEITTSIERLFAKLEDRFIERGLRGQVTDAHGALQLDRIWFEVRGRGAPELSIIGRQIARPRAFAAEHGVDRTLYRHADCLDDVAALSVDLRSCGLQAAAEQFEQIFFKLHPEAADSEVLRFFQMVHTVRQAMRALDLSSADDQILDSDLLLRSRAIGLRASLGLVRPFAIAFPTAGLDDCADDAGAAGRERRRDLMRSIAELADAPMLTLDHVISKLQVRAKALGPFHHLAQSEISLHDQFIEQLRSHASAGRVLIFEWPSSGREAMERLSTAAADIGMPLLVVHCGLGRAELVNQASLLKSDQPIERDSCSGLAAVGQLENVLSTVVEPTVTSPDLGLSILREFSTRLISR